MAVTDLTSLEYLIPRVIGWTLLLLVACVDTLRHRTSKRRGYQLQRGIVVCIFAYVVQDVLLLAYSVLASGGSGGSKAQDDVRKAYYVFSDLADSVFMGLLLLIAAGYCITRDNLGPYKGKVLLTPVIYFVTKAVTDLILDAYEGDGTDTVISIADFDPWTWFVLYIAQVVSLMAFMLALVFIFEIVHREVESVTQPREGIIGAATAEQQEAAQQQQQAQAQQRPGLVSRHAQAQAQAQAQQEGQGHTVALPHEVTENGQPLGEVYAEVTGEDHDAPKTVEEALQHRTKVTLMKQFSWAAAACVVCYIAALLVPLFYYSAPGEEDTAVLVVLILWNCVRWLFLAGLCFIFRARENNPYLLLDEEGGLDTDFSSVEVHTELGVLSSTSDKTLEEGGGVDRTYSLGDDSDDESAARGRRRLVPPGHPKSSID